MNIYTVRTYTDNVNTRVSADANPVTRWLGTTEIFRFTNKRQATQFAKAYAKANGVWVELMSHKHSQVIDPFPHNLILVASFNPRGVVVA